MEYGTYPLDEQGFELTGDIRMAKRQAIIEAKAMIESGEAVTVYVLPMRDRWSVDTSVDYVFKAGK